MAFILGRYKVDDVEAWKKIVASHREMHLEMGMQLQEVWTNVEDPREIFFLFRADDLKRAQSGLEAQGALDKEKQQRGEIPTLWFIESRYRRALR